MRRQEKKAWAQEDTGTIIKVYEDMFGEGNPAEQPEGENR
jgi:hypothetical protein